MIEGVQNHTPEVMVIDEIGRSSEVEAARTTSNTAFVSLLQVIACLFCPCYCLALYLALSLVPNQSRTDLG